MTHHSLTPAKYATDSAASAAVLDVGPEADSPEDVTTRTVPLDGGTAVVEHIGDRAEVTVRIGDRLACALILSPAEAEALGAALARPHGVTVSDYWALSDALGAA